MEEAGRGQRLITRSRQGGLGETSAIDWFTRLGAVVFVPVGHSPAVDLVALLDGNPLRIQVKTSAQRSATKGGESRFPVQLVTCGGNRSWTGERRTLDFDAIDYLFALTASGRRWCIPAAAIEAASAITLGGDKYSEFEIDPAAPIESLVHSEEALLDSRPRLGEYPSGQRMATVNRPAQPSQVRILPPPSDRPRFSRTRYERRRGQSGQALINSKRRVTLPQSAVLGADLRDGDRLRVSADGYGRILLERIELPAAGDQPELPAA